MLVSNLKGKVLQILITKFQIIVKEIKIRKIHFHIKFLVILVNCIEGFAIGIFHIVSLCFRLAPSLFRGLSALT